MLYFEKYLPVVLSLILSITFFWKYDHIVDANKLVNNLVDSSFVINGVLIGFLLTITTLLHTINTRRMAFVKDLGGFPKVVKYLNLAIYFNLFSITIYLFLPFFNFIDVIKQSSLKDSIILFLILYTWLLNIRFTLIFISLIVDRKSNN